VRDVAIALIIPVFKKNFLPYKNFSSFNGYVSIEYIIIAMAL